ncbi:DNA helicase-4 [Marininema halotolerans]|uniref:DNA 3'-5' helicase n=1 Tax=Marininema halotolerans TaxID=1155944 RepID=A0A1I6Q4E9_9BACL|nr:DNA helicase-4 [Marininema halotolerans]
MLAGAGSGKTLTISGKVKYLVDKKKIAPEKILLISYTRKAAEEMTDRIVKKLNVNVQSSTFHKLGLEIIKEYRGNRPSIAEENALSNAVEHYIEKELYQDKKQVERIIKFFSYYINIPRDYSDFKTLGEYHEHCKNLEFVPLKEKVNKKVFIDNASDTRKKELKTLKKEKVKSIEEVMIANFLFLNSVEYVYEENYKHKTEDARFRQYKPDFYLPEYDIYLEHFGLSEDGRVPWLSGGEAQKYLDGVKWKRNLHKEHGTKMIETYSYYNKKGILFTKLREELESNGIKMYEIDYQEIFSIIFNQDQKEKHFGDFIKLISTFIGLFKSNGYTENTLYDFIEKNKKEENNAFIRDRTDIFFNFIKPIYMHYEDKLSGKKEIDFNDMINQATEIIQSGEVTRDYKYIMIDEYQDISQSRFNLVQAIQEQTSAKVVCVGDDWQSIYRFAGSDVQLFTEFGKFFGNHELMRIEKTYRNSQELIDVAGNFVMQNPSQLIKNLTSSKQVVEESPIKIIGFDNNIQKALVDAIDQIVTNYGEDAEIMLLGRNKSDLDKVIDSADFKKKYDRKANFFTVVYNKYHDVKLFFLTAHRSKGLEASHVILINADNKINGFPNKMVDDPIQSWVLTDSDDYLYGEERRLFYVALTRTKNDCYILTQEERMSAFVRELINEYKIPYQSVTKGKSVLNNPNCPRCKSGYLTRKEKTNFIFCTNFSGGCDYKAHNSELIDNPILCDSCGDFMVVRKGPRGEFLGCNNYRFEVCSNSKDLPKGYKKRKSAKG